MAEYRMNKFEYGTDTFILEDERLIGMNLIPLSKNLESFTHEDDSRVTVIHNFDDCIVTNTYASSSVKYGIYYDVDVVSNETYSLSFNISSKSGSAFFAIGNRTSGQSASWTNVVNYVALVVGQNIKTFTIPSGMTRVRIYICAQDQNSTFTISKIKLERGATVTEWTPFWIETSDGGIKTYSIRDPQGTLTEILSTVTDTDVKAVNSSLTTSSTDDDWLKALLVAICKKYPNKSGHVFKGKLAPNSSGIYKIYIYNTSTVDSTTKLPEYSFGLFRKWGQIYKTFSTSSYVFTCSDVNTNTWRGIQDNLTSTSTTDSLSANQGRILDTNKINKSIGTTKGDILYWSGASTPARLGIGSNGKVLKVVSGVPAWADDNNTTYTAGTGLSLSGTTFNHSNSVTAGTAGTSSATSGTTTLAVPYVTYDAQGHITGSGTHTHTISSYPEAFLTWGGKSFSGDYAPIDAALVPELGANRLAFLDPSRIQIEYSRNGGTDWHDYGATNEQKLGLFSEVGTSLQIGKADSSNKATNQFLLRVTLSFYPDNTIPNAYTALNKFVIYVSTNSNSGCYVLIDHALKSSETTYTLVEPHGCDATTKRTPLSGWSGYNIINFPSFTTYANSSAQSWQYSKVRFTFGCTGGTGTTSNGFTILKILGFGGVGWGTPSTMAKYGRIYTYDVYQNTTFPAKVTATNFVGSINSVNIKAVVNESFASGGWSKLNGLANSPTIVIGKNNSAAVWNSDSHSSSLVFGGGDTRGLLDIGYNSPLVTFGGTSVSQATEDAPKWYFKLSATSDKTYTFPTDSKTLAATDGSNATGTWGINISGNATSATTASKATAANLTTNTNGVPYFTNTNGTFGNIRSASGAFYSTGQDVKPIFGTLPTAQGGTGNTTYVATHLIYASSTTKIEPTKFMHMGYTTGTTETIGKEELVIGNQIASGTDGNAYGQLSMYSSSTSGGYFRQAPCTSWMGHILPAATGWVVTGGNGSTTGVGSATQPIYVSTSGVATACTYSLKATVNNGTASYMAYYSGANAVSSSNSIYITNTPESKDGNGNTTIEAHQNLYLNHEGVIYFRVPRKTADGGGWAITPLRFIDASQTAYAFLGLHGNNNTFNWMYIGSNEYNSNLNLRIKPNGDVQANNYISNYLTTGQLTATSANIGTLAVTGNSTFSNNISVLGKIDLNRRTNASYGRIGYYDPAYRTWYTYMSNNVAGAAPTGGTPSQLGVVTSWALRSLIENSNGYGWMWETSSNATPSSSSVTPTAIMSLSSNKGWLRIAPVAATTTTCGNSALTIDSATNNSGGNVGLEFYRSSSGNSIASWQIGVEGNDLHIRDNYTTTSQTTYANDQIKIVCNTGNVVMRGALTLGDYVIINHATECGFVINNTQSSNPKRVGLIVGTSGNGGIWDYTKSKWVVYSNPSGNVVLNGTANDLLNFTTTKNTALNTINNGNIDATNTTNAIGYVNGLTAADWNGNQVNGALFRQYYDSTCAYQIFGDYRSGQMALRGRSSSTWHSWRIVLDSVNYSNYAIGKDGGTINGVLNVNNTLNADNITTGNLSVNGIANFTQGIYATNVSCVTPQMFGAYGDGEHDDTAAIQRALNSSLEVFFPEGVYMISSTLNIYHKAHLWGTGGASKIRAMETFTGTYMAQAASYTNGIPDKMSFCIEHLEFSCFNRNVRGLFLARPYNRCTVRDVYITGCYRTAIWVGDTTLNSNQTAYVLSTSDSRSQTLVIDNCYFGDSSVTQTEPLAYFYNSFELNLKDTKFIYATLSAYPCLILDFCYDAYVRGCSFLKTSVEAVKIIRNCRYFRFIGNTYENIAYQTSNPTISCEGTTAYNVGGNIIEGIFIETPYYNTSRKIRLTSTKHITIIGGFNDVTEDAGSATTFYNTLTGGTLSTTNDIENAITTLRSQLWYPYYKEYSITTETNSAVSPWGAYKVTNISSDISNYGEPLSCMVKATANNNPASAVFVGNNLVVYSKTAVAGITARVLFAGVKTA